jgi:hypothetical protein
MACMVATFASLMQFSVAAHAERVVSVTHQKKGRAIDPLAGFITEAFQTVRSPGALDTFGNARGECR